MLYERWCGVANKFSGAAALIDAASGQRWTFGELASIAESGESAPELVFPATGADFVFSVLKAWRGNGVTCPLEPGQVPPALRQAPPGSIVHLKTTSATGGQPRMVAFTAGQLAADADNIVETMGLRPDWPNLGAISLAHSYGFSNLLLPLLLHGIPLVLVGTALPESLKRAAALFPEVTLPAVPALWNMWLEANAVPGNVRLAISAGAPLPLALEEKIFDRCGLKIHTFYGSTECGGIAYDGSSTPRSDGTCVGGIMRNVEVRIGGAGCVEVRGRAVGQAYWPEAGKSLGEGVFRTSDLGRIRNGLLFLSGRLGDLINVAGRKIAPEVIEQTLAKCPGLKDCIVFGVPAKDGRRGESIVGCIVAQAGLTAENLRQFASAKLPAWQVPREWWFVDSLQANGRGKVSRADLRNRYARQRGEAGTECARDVGSAHA